MQIAKAINSYSNLAPTNKIGFTLARVFQTKHLLFFFFHTQTNFKVANENAAATAYLRLYLFFLLLECRFEENANGRPLYIRK
jgi:hypothetical protein